MKDKKDILTDLVETGADISGGIAGSVIGGLVAGPAGMILGGASGPLITKALKKMGIEIKKRFISPREHVRIGAAYTFAIQRLNDNQKNGKEIREDAFFDTKNNDRSDSEEVLEGIILAAQKEYEERKVQFLGNLYANICTNKSITREHANQLIKSSNILSFRQFCILQLLKEKYEKSNELKFKIRSLEDRKISIPDLIIEIRDLQQRGLLSLTARINDIDNNSVPIAQDDIAITEAGLIFCEMLSLVDLPKEDLKKLNDSIKLII